MKLNRCGLIAVAALAACAERSGNAPARDAAPDEWSAHDDAAVDARGSADAAADGLSVPEGTCAVVRSFDVAATDPQATFVRVGGVFRAGPWGHSSVPGIRSAVVGDDGAVHAATLPLANDVYAALPIGPDPFAGNEIWIDRRDGVGYVSPIFSRLVGPTVGESPEHDLGELYLRGTESLTVAASFDGQRGLLVSGHSVTQAPRLFLLDAEGNRVGNVTDLSNPAGEVTFSCLHATPTAHGGASSMITTSPMLGWRFVEFGADGRPGRGAQLDWPGLAVNGPCPTVRATSTGYRAFVPRGGQKVGLFDLRGEPLFVAPPLLDAEVAGTPVWAGGGSDGGFALLVRAAGGSSRMISIDRAGHASGVQGDLPDGTVIPSEPGRLFLDVADHMTGRGRQIVEIACNDPRVVID